MRHLIAVIALVFITACGSTPTVNKTAIAAAGTSSTASGLVVRLYANEAISYEKSEEYLDRIDDMIDDIESAEELLDACEDDRCIAEGSAALKNFRQVLKEFEDDLTLQLILEGEENGEQ